MKVLFIKHLRGKGTIGDIKEVPDGYGMNFLIAQGYAVRATDDVVKKYQQEKENKELSEKKNEEEVAKKFTSVNKKVIKIQVSQKDLSGKLYKSIPVSEIILEIKKQLDVSINKEWIQYIKPIKEVGEHLLRLQYHAITAEFIVEVS